MRRLESGVCGARGRGSQPRTREAPGTGPGGMMTALPGARLDWDWRAWPRPRKHRPGDRNRRGGAPGGAPPPRKRRGRASPACRAASPGRPERVRSPLAFPGAPLPSCGERSRLAPAQRGRGNAGLPGAGQKMRAMARARGTTTPAHFRASGNPDLGKIRKEPVPASAGTGSKQPR